MKIPRNRDVIYCNFDLQHLFTFPSFPVFMGCASSDSDVSKDLKEGMSFWISEKSGMIQLIPLLPLEVVYPEAHGAGAVGSSWERHHKSFAEFISKFSPLSVLEIGGAHGVLAKNYQGISMIPWTILEPNPTPVEGCNASIIRGFFDDKFELSEKVNAVVHSHVFEHIYDPREFIGNLSKFMTDGSKMQVMMERKYTNCLNFEHTIFLTEDYIDFLLTEGGFRIIDKHYFLDDHSIFYSAVRDDGLVLEPLPVGLYKKNRDNYLAYINEHLKLIKSINSTINKRANVFLFGAHAQAQYLVGFGLDLSFIEGVLDNDKNKHGKRLYGTDKIVYPPEALEKIENPMVIVRAGTFTSEILDQIRSINPMTEFLL